MAPPTTLRPAWNLRRADPGAVAALERDGLPRLSATLLALRGHRDPREVKAHLSARPMDLHDPSLLPGMEAGTERVARAIADGETILVHGDYDVDGVTGTSLLMRLFDLLGARAEWHIPNRLVDGYSFGPHSIERAEATGAGVVISVDNGTSAHSVIGELRERGIDTVVTDHHEAPPGPLPAATAIINPKLPDSTYPWRELCGGAVAFKFAWGLAQRLRAENRPVPDLKAFLEEATAYVAIATVSDVVPLLSENRVFARFGLKALAGSSSPGLRAMLKVAGLSGRPLTAEDVAFQIGPRINASGRLGSAQKAVELLLAKDDERALELARELDELNQERRRIEREVLAEARVAAGDYADADEHPVLFLAGEGWHQGVVGIVAARLTEEFGRPAIVVGLEGDSGRGSARTVGRFSVLEALSGAAPVCARFGGHEQAAGLEIEAAAVDEARRLVNDRAREMLAGGSYPAPELTIDLELPFEEMTPDAMRQLDLLAPFGEGNEKPVLRSSEVFLARPPRAVGADGSHLMLELRRGNHVLKAMAFGEGRRLDELAMGKPLDVVYSPTWNTFRGETKLELVLADFRPAASTS